MSSLRRPCQTLGFLMVLLTSSLLHGASTPTVDSVKSVVQKVVYSMMDEDITRAEWREGAYFTGHMAAYELLQDEAIHQFALDWAQLNQWTPHGGVSTTFADNHACTQTYCELFLLDSTSENEYMIEPTKQTFNKLVGMDKKKGRDLWWWCDALYMAPPGMARLAYITGDTAYLNAMDRFFWDTKEYLYDTEEHLFYRHDKYFDHVSENGFPVFWSRGNGWVIGALGRILDYLPEDWSTREQYEELFVEMAAKLKSIQGSDGLWRTSLMDSAQFPMEETSGSSFFCYGLAWGVNNGYLTDPEYRGAALLAWEGLVSKVDEDGVLLYAQKTGQKPEEFNPNDKSLNTRLFSSGALLLAGNEIAKLVNPTGTIQFSINRAESSTQRTPTRFLTGSGLSTRRQPQTRTWDVLGRGGSTAPVTERTQRNATRILITHPEHRE